MTSSCEDKAPIAEVVAEDGDQVEPPPEKVEVNPDLTLEDREPCP